MKAIGSLIDFIVKQWLLMTSALFFVLIIWYTRRIPCYSLKEWQVLYIFFILFVAVSGLQQSGLLSRIAQGIEKGRAIPLKLVLITFFLSMLITIDVTLIIIVPMTLAMNVDRKEFLVILESLAANTGSALTPFGNPQNLFIYWFYNVHPTAFIETIVLFSFAFLILLALASLFVRTKRIAGPKTKQKIDKKAYIYTLLLIIVILTIFHVLPISVGIVVPVFALLFDRRAFRIDYALLLIFFFFFGIADDLKTLLYTELNHSGHIFLFSALASQVISNVPATLLFAEFTSNWEALLWGANAGGLGGLFGSMARLIVYKIYVSHESTTHAGRFTALFLITGYLAMGIAIVLYFYLYLPYRPF